MSKLTKLDFTNDRYQSVRYLIVEVILDFINDSWMSQSLISIISESKLD